MGDEAGYCLDAADGARLDALAALAAAGAWRAIAALDQLVDGQIDFVPAVPVIRCRAAGAAGLGLDLAASVIGVRQLITGACPGRALLIFPDRPSLDPVRIALAGDQTLQDVQELETDALAEIGNVVLNACVGTLANRLGQALPMSLPDVVRGSVSDVLASGHDRAGARIHVGIGWDGWVGGRAGRQPVAGDRVRLSRSDPRCCGIATPLSHVIAGPAGAGHDFRSPGRMRIIFPLQMACNGNNTAGDPFFAA